MNGTQDFMVGSVIGKSFADISGSLKDFFYVTWFPSLGLAILYVFFGMVWGDEYSQIMIRSMDGSANFSNVVFGFFGRWDFIAYSLFSLFIGFWASSVTACLWLLRIRNGGKGGATKMLDGIVVWNDKIRRVFLLWVSIFFILMISHIVVGFLEVSILSLLVGSFAFNPVLIFVVLLFFHLIFGLYLWSRLSLVYPASVTSSPISFYQSWQLTTNTGLIKKLMLVTFVSYVLVGLATFLVMALLSALLNLILSDSLVLSLIYFFLQAESSFFIQLLWLGSLYYIYEMFDS